MLYGILRILFFMIIYAIGIILITKSKNKKNKLYLALISIGFILCSAFSTLVPVENLFINFKSPESVFKYVGIGKIKNVNCGESSCMIIFTDKKNSYKYSYSTVLKTSKGYKIGTTLSYKNVYTKKAGSKYLEVYNVVNTDDYYVFGLFSSKEVETRLSDSKNTEFKNVILSKEDADYKTYITNAYVEDIDKDYYVTFESEKIYVKK
jgi:hypothetical protein